MDEASYDDGWGLRSNSKYTKHSATSGTRLIFMSIAQMMIGSVSIMVAVMLTETAATHSPLSKLMDSLN
jgi:heme A synthase